MKCDSNILAFFALLRAGLWEKEVRLSDFGEIDYSAMMKLAEEQSVVGIITAGLEQVKDVKIPQEWSLQFIGSTLQIEQRNKEMNKFVANLIERLRNTDIYTLLVKGQGIAQCYERPLWRASGDVDLFLSDENYKKAIPVLTAIASSVDDENVYSRHLAMVIDGWSVELHGTLRSGLWRSIDKEIDIVQDEVFYGGNVRSWMNGQTQVFLPAADEDMVFVFSHILQHFFLEGIGLRQICDWCRLLWTYRDSLDLAFLEASVRKMGVMSEWKTFAFLAVDYLGMPAEAIPFFSSEKHWSKKADQIMTFVLETGNFGHNRDYSYQQKYPFVVYKAISLWKHIKDFGRYFVIFPLDAVKVTWNRMILGFSVAFKGEGHE